MLVYPTTHSNRLAEYEKEDRTLVDYYALAPVPTDYSVAAGETMRSKPSGQKTQGFATVRTETPKTTLCYRIHLQD